jgi:protein required for attachment to host cells
MKKKIITWVIALDGQIAHILEKTHPLKPKLKLIQEINSEPSLEHKKPGRTFDSLGMSRHSIEPHTNPKEVERQHFVVKIIKILEESLKNKCFEKLIIVAPPKMLGITLQHLTDSLKHKLVYKLPKNILDGKIANIGEYLSEMIDFRTL